MVAHTVSMFCGTQRYVVDWDRSYPLEYGSMLGKLFVSLKPGLHLNANRMRT